ncbi:MAG: hypothetical protein M3R65_01930 [Gemmatimonadota bacterium]|nr:hypothetical protein [Gemmatimonadota bacterium]
MLTSITLLAAAIAAGPAAPTVSQVLHAPPITAQPVWRPVRADTVGDLLFTTETMGDRLRFVARGLKGAVPVTTSDFPADSVRAWVKSASELVSSASPKQGEMRGLGQALTLNVTTTGAGETVFGFYVGDATTDQQLALALTKAASLKLTAGVSSALDTMSH